jgi:hypothetical protein
VFSRPIMPMLFCKRGERAPDADASTFGSRNNDSSVAALIRPLPLVASMADSR